KELGVNKVSVFRALKGAGVVLRKNGPRPRTRRFSVEEARRLYESGLSYRGGGERLGGAGMTVGKALRLEGVEGHKPKRTFSVEEACRLYQSGMSCLKVAEAMGLGYATVYTALEEAGVLRKGQPGARTGSR